MAVGIIGIKAIQLLRVSHPSKVLLSYLLWSQCSYTVCSMFVLHVRSKGHGCLLCTEIDKCQPHKPQHRKRRHIIPCSEHLLHPLLLLSCLPTDTLLFIQQATTVTKTKPNLLSKILHGGQPKTVPSSGGSQSANFTARVHREQQVHSHASLKIYITSPFYEGKTAKHPFSSVRKPFIKSI